MHVYYIPYWVIEFHPTTAWTTSSLEETLDTPIQASVYILVPWLLVVLCIHNFSRTSCTGNAFVAHQSMQNAVSVRPLCPVVLQLGITTKSIEVDWLVENAVSNKATKSSCVVQTDNGCCCCVLMSFVDWTLKKDAVSFQVWKKTTHWHDGTIWRMWTLQQSIATMETLTSALNSCSSGIV